MHELEYYDFELPRIEDALAGDSRTLAFQVVDADGNGVDITPATVAWALFEREYQSDVSDAVIDESDSEVSVVTSGGVDPTLGEFEVQLSPGATDAIWGEFYHRPEVTQADGSVVSWRGELILTA
jgi:hypothetical protein